MRNTICVIGAYFGNFNNYFPLWLRSCENNPKIDFIIFNDCDYREVVPRNVRLIPFSLAKMKALAIEKTGIDNLYLDKPYKCCDFKPLYGEIFADYISEYEYWGHCDFDLIWGNLYEFMVKNEYQKYDKFLNLGHLSFYRNTPEINHRYTKEGGVNSYIEALTSEDNMSFDENGGMGKIYLHNKYPFFYKRVYADISPIYHRYKLSEYCSLDEPDKNYKKQVFYWKDGRTYRAYVSKDKTLHTEEFMYIHFQKRPNYPLMTELMSVNAFFITNKGFLPMTKSEISMEDIKKYNRQYPFIEIIEKAKWWSDYYWGAIKKRIIPNG